MKILVAIELRHAQESKSIGQVFLPGKPIESAVISQQKSVCELEPTFYEQYHVGWEPEFETIRESKGDGVGDFLRYASCYGRRESSAQHKSEYAPLGGSFSGDIISSNYLRET